MREQIQYGWTEPVSLTGDIFHLTRAGQQVGHCREMPNGTWRGWIDWQGIVLEFDVGGTGQDLGAQCRNRLLRLARKLLGSTRKVIR